ncbi:MAG: glycoside hydrolase family 3 C-terminal domain-containing protein [Bacteroides sp.]|nr:glycoside hydrolase family 3 C-terminal domain-containing protein [Bacteroides sp.]MCM1420329.1 glycoside hydrolase family 3 C-terminal domain-containing protein [Bacteroides sp.]
MSMAVMAHETHDVQPAIPYDAELEKEVEQTLSRLTLDEKIGQMCELTIDVVTDMSSKDICRLDEEKMNKVFNTYKVGSILNVPLSIAQTPDTWCRLIRELNLKSMAVSKGIPQIYGVDQIHGASYSWGATLFPQEIGQAASFNRNIPRRVSEIAAYESRACLIPWVYSPTMDLGRQPLWSRMWESYGEDAYLSAEMAVQAVRGYQGCEPNHIGTYNVAACLKHYMAYGVPASGKDRTPSYVAAADLREKFFEPFRAAIRAGALSVMVSSGVNNGVPFHANREMLTVWLKEQLNWDGMIVTDWADINNLCLRDHVASTKKEAIEMAVNAGIDMSMVPYEAEFCDLLRELVEEGRVPMERIDDAVRRILRLKLRIGLHDRDSWDLTPKQMKKKFKDFGSDKFAAEATRMAEECMVLLKNDNHILPLKEGTRILMCGPNADNMRSMNGGWSYTWQGDRTNEVCAEIGKYNTFYAAMRKRFGEQNVVLCEGVKWDSGNWQKEKEEDFQSVKETLDNVDVAVIVVGENSYCETPGNITDLTLSRKQRMLVEALAEKGKPLVLVLNEGRPRIISDIEPLAKAIVHTFLPGNYGGDALARLMAGDTDFSGRMPYTYPRTTGSIATYDYKPCENMGQMDGNYNYDAVMDVQYPFGYGLSYTTFAYSNLMVDKDSFTATDTLTFSVDVTNTGDRRGKEAVLLFVSDLVASTTPDTRRLRAFEKVELESGETKNVKLKLAGADLAFVGNDNRWRLEAGNFRACVCGQSVMVKCSETHIWQNPNK